MDREAQILLERASALRRAGRIEEAITAYRELLSLQPNLSESWFNLGWLQRQARQYEAALESYAEALHRGVSTPEEVHLNRAVILSDNLANPGQAELELKAALEINPGYLPAILNLGNLHEDLGRRDLAELSYRRALELAPENALALSRLAGVLEPSSTAAGEVVGWIEHRIGSATPAADRADLGFALGRLRDGRGEFEAAFAAYEAANQASRESFGRSFRPYDRFEAEAYFDRLIAAFPRARRKSSKASPAIFICGMFRSGSTLVEHILAGHSRLVSGGELDLISAAVSNIRGYPEAVSTAGESEIAQWRRFYLDGLQPLVRKGTQVTDKRPDNFLHIGLIKTLFPEAKIVHTRRNRLDNLLSLFFLHLGPAMPYALDLADAAHWYQQYDRLMKHWARLYPTDIFDVEYNELVRDPVVTTSRLVGFLGLEWEESLLDFHSRSGPVKTASVWQVRKPIHTASSGRWRNYSLQLQARLGASAISGD